MFDALLVPLDGSPFSEYSLPLAAALSRSSGARLHLAHVHHDNPPDGLLSNTQFQFEGLDLGEYEERHRADERDYLGTLAARLEKEMEVPPEQVLLEGEVVGALEWYAGERGPALILMTTHGRTGVSRAWLGSVADVLVRRTHLPVLLVHPPQADEVRSAPEAVRHILVPLDGSELSEKILGTVRKVATAMGSRITLAHVVQPLAHMGARPLPLPSGHVGERSRKAEEYLATVAGRLSAEGFEVDTRVVVDASPALAILQAAESVGADLVAMGTHGYRGVTRAVLGSVADKVLRASPVPVLLERPLTQHLD